MYSVIEDQILNLIGLNVLFMTQKGATWILPQVLISCLLTYFYNLANYSFLTYASTRPIMMLCNRRRRGRAGRRRWSRATWRWRWRRRRRSPPPRRRRCSPASGDISRCQSPSSDIILVGQLWSRKLKCVISIKQFIFFFWSRHIEIKVWPSWSPNSTYLHLDFYLLSTDKN